jgi:Bacterial Ig-like domain (group 3)/MBG domain (YGX type)/PQQ enzyme repeat
VYSFCCHRFCGVLLTKHSDTFFSIEDNCAPPAKAFLGLERLTRVFAQACLCLWLLAYSSLAATAQVNVYTRSYDNARSGANLQETILTPANVNSTSFGKLFTVHTDGEIYAQPLYVSNLAIAGGTHNVVFAASMLNTVYAIDADTGTVYWSQNFGSPIVPQDVENDQNIIWATRLGILSTPVIDPATNIMYFVSGSQPASGAYQYAFNLNAIEIATGLPVSGSPVNITATYSTPDLTTPLVFNAQKQNPRPGLALANGNVYITFASHEDQTPYNGWVMAYSTSTLAQTAVYSDTTIGTQGGIWSAGQAPSIDAAGNIYISTGNGSFGATPNKLVQTGNSFIKLSPTLQLLDYFTPYNSAVMNSGDMDLGSSGLLLIPNTNYVLGGGKEGVLYLVDTTAMGEFNASSDQVRQEFQAVYGVGTSHIHGGPVYFNSDANGPSTYVWGENDVLRGFEFNTTTGLLTTTPFAKSTMTAPATNNDGAMPGGFLAVSANGNSNGILWASTPYNGNAVHVSVQGVLYAFNADTLSLLWTDKTSDARDEIGMFAKYVPPVVANGKVYVPNFGPVGNTDGSGNLVVYGLLPQLTVAVANATMTVGAALPPLTGTVTGLVNGDTLGTTIAVAYSTTASSSSPAGTYPITATVTGSSAGNYHVVVNAGTLTISPVAQPLTVNANNATRAYGAANPTFTGTVTGAQSGDTFTESFTTTATTTSAVGSYPIVPSVTGTNLGNYIVTIVNGALTVTAAATTTTLTATASAAYGAGVTLTATVVSTAGTPGGTVTFYNGATPVGAGALNTSGVATLSTTTLPPGTDSITAAYAATGNFAASTSAASGVSIGQETQTITFAAIPSRAYGSAPFAVSATSSAGSNYPVTITVASGPAVIAAGTVTLTGVGTVVLQAAQAGNADYSAATATQSFQVTGAATTTTLTGPASAAVGDSVTLTATVASAAGVPAGSVTFFSGTTSLGVGTLNGSGVATLATTALPAGTDTATATYTAAGNFSASTSSPVTLTISAPGGAAAAYTVTANPGTLTITPGATGSTTLTITPTGGYKGTIALSCSSLPTNATCAFAQNPLALSGNNQSVTVGLQINTTAQQAARKSPASQLNPTLLALAFWWPGGLTGLAVFLRKRKLVKTQPSWLFLLLFGCTFALAAGLSGCGTSGSTNSATPSTFQVIIVATGTSDTAVTTLTVPLTLNVTQ